MPYIIAVLVVGLLGNFFIRRVKAKRTRRVILVATGVVMVALLALSMF